MQAPSLTPAAATTERARGDDHAQPDVAVLAKHSQRLDSLRKPALHLVRSAQRGWSRIGGRPAVPRDFVWPTWKGKPQSFLGQIDLAAVPPRARPEALPSAGFLYFFFTAAQDTWGGDANDRGSWRVYFLDHLAKEEERPFPKDLPEDGRFAEVPVAFAAVETYPDGQDDRIEALKLDDLEQEAYDALRFGVFGKHPLHQLLGYASPIQGNDMELECQLTSYGQSFGNPSGAVSPERAVLEKGKADWMLLFQLDSDDDAQMMWGDAGRLYFWITKQDLARRDFSKVWMILQCY